MDKFFEMARRPPVVVISLLVASLFFLLHTLAGTPLLPLAARSFLLWCLFTLVLVLYLFLVDWVKKIFEVAEDWLKKDGG